MRRRAESCSLCLRQFSHDFATMLEWFDAVGYDADISALEAEFDYRMTRFRDWAVEHDWSI